MNDADVLVPDTGPKIVEAPSTSGEVVNGYVGVIYFHGMGEQRRMEEVSRLVESIDTYLHRSSHVHQDPQGHLGDIRTTSEPHRVKGRTEEQVYFTSTRHFGAEFKKQDPVRAARFYEVYWAPHMAQGRDPWGVTKWIVRQIKRPFIMLATPWRERQRLRRATLAEMFETGEYTPSEEKRADFERLLSCYHAFGQAISAADEKDPGNREDSVAALKQNGKFGAFQTFLARTNRDDQARAARLDELARRWRRAYFGAEFFNLGAMITVAVAGLLVMGALVALVLSVLSLVIDYFNGQNWEMPMGLTADWTTAAGLAGSLALAGGLGKFLGRFMGDVESWASLSETDALHERRKAVLNEGIDVMRHVLSDPKCQRVIVISHSLGTSVAHDTLLALAQRNRGHDNDGDIMRGPIALTKIRHLVTIASPIDKINYFFESYRTKYPSYSRAYEAMRGDIQSAPFSRNTTQPYIHWVNYWDGADVISGSLQSPTAAEGLAHRVNNVHISNEQFPSPGRAHSAYFQNRTVISQLFEMIYRGTGHYDGNNVPYVDGDPRKGKDYAALDFKPRRPSGSGAIYRGLAALLIWSAVATALGFLFDLPNVRIIAGGITATSAFMIFIGWGTSIGAGNKEPL